MPTKRKLAQMRAAKEKQMKLRKGAEIMALLLCSILSIGILAYAKESKPATMQAKVVGVEYHNGKTDLLAELPDGNIEWWTLDYAVYNIPSEIEILVENHEIYDCPQ